MLKYKLSPSILSADFANLARDMALAEQADWMHIDVMDGLFVPNITIGPPVVKCLAKVSPLPMDVHLMIDRPSRYVKNFLDAGANVLTLHVESDTTDNLLEAWAHIRAAGASPAVTLRPGTPLSALAPHLPLVDMVLIMTVEPGFGGQSFMPDSLEKISACRTLLDRVNPTCEIEVDGGITLENAAQVARAGATVIVAGSAVFGAPDVPIRVREFQEIFKEIATGG